MWTTKTEPKHQWDRILQVTRRDTNDYRWYRAHTGK
jgi:hypothetical protein